MWNGKQSVYQEKFDDAMGIFFTEEEFPALKTSKDDVSEVLQDAIGRLIETQCYGILYIPSGEYRLKETVKIPPSVRLIGYGKERPVFILPEDAKGYDETVGDIEYNPNLTFQDAYPKAKYMFWFIGERDYMVDEPRDANAGTFYSAISNIDFRIEGNHPGAICIRAHFAQHGFISHCHFDLGDGLAAIFDVGNEMEDLTFVGGTYGIVCRMTSPGWPFALLDSVFEGQKKAAVLTSRTGFTGFRLRITDTPKAFGIYLPGTWEKLYLEDCIFENISEAAISCYQAENVIQQTNLHNIYCKNVPVLVKKIESGECVGSQEHMYLVRDYLCGYYLEDTAEAKQSEIYEIAPLEEFPDCIRGDIPKIPSMTDWVSVRKYGAVGDGVTDDTKALQDAIDKEDILYLPQGIYRITDTLYLKENSCLIGLSPITTQIVIEDDTPAYAGFGTPKALVESARGGCAYISGIGIDTAGKNPRAVGVKWMAGEKSYMNDVKFVGGHGLMYRDGRNAFAYLYNASRTADYDPDRIWDYQYASLWITNGGGGIFKDLWSASPYAEAGIAVTNTNTPGRMYAISLEHHVRSEIKLHKVSNWVFYALQTEEEKAEGLTCLPMELVSCENVTFVNYYLFRVVAVDQPYETGIRLWDCKNIVFMNLHNKAQMQYIFTVTLEDKTSGFYAKSPEYARLVVSGEVTSKEKQMVEGYEVIADGCRFAQGATLDENGNLYWCDKSEKRIYKYCKDTGVIVPFYDIHFMPSALAVDSAGHLLVAVDYSELKKRVPGQPFQEHDFTNFHPFFSWFYKRSERMYAVSLENPFDTMAELEQVAAKDVNREVIYRPAQMDYPGMFDMVIEQPVKAYYMAPDGKCAVEATIDLARTLVLQKAVKGEEFLLSDDADRTVYSCKVTDGGNYTDRKKVTDKGQYGALRDKNGTVWCVDDMLYGYRDGVQTEAIRIPRDVYAVIGRGTDAYLIGRSRIYQTDFLERIGNA